MPSGVIYRLSIDGLVDGHLGQPAWLTIHQGETELSDDELCDVFRAAMRVVRSHLNPPRPGWWNVSYEMPAHTDWQMYD
jgi:hypothetical protein